MVNWMELLLSKKRMPVNEEIVRYAKEINPDATEEWIERNQSNLLYALRRKVECRDCKGMNTECSTGGRQTVLEFVGGDLVAHVDSEVCDKFMRGKVMQSEKAPACG